MSRIKIIAIKIVIVFLLSLGGNLYVFEPKRPDIACSYVL